MDGEKKEKINEGDGGLIEPGEKPCGCAEIKDRSCI